MELKLSKKITKPDFQGEFTASILAAAASPDIISFAGGLPNPVSFPVEEMDAAHLGVPDTTRLLYALNREGCRLPLEAITTEECAQALLRAFGLM